MRRNLWKKGYICNLMCCDGWGNYGKQRSPGSAG